MADNRISRRDWMIGSGSVLGCSNSSHNFCAGFGPSSQSRAGFYSPIRQ